jgi:hypothetical protein
MQPFESILIDVDSTASAHPTLDRERERTSYSGWFIATSAELCRSTASRVRSTGMEVT